MSAYLFRLNQARKGNCPRTYNFGSPKAPKISPPTPAPPPPTIDVAAQSQKNTDELRQRRGASANVLAGSDPSAPPTTGITKLLGM
jgi:hypothetical protein